MGETPLGNGTVVKRIEWAKLTPRIACASDHGLHPGCYTSFRGASHANDKRRVPCMAQAMCVPWGCPSTHHCIEMDKRTCAVQCRTGEPRSAQVASIPSMRILPAGWSNPSSWELATTLSRVFQTTLCSSFKPASTQLANMLQNPCGINNNTDDVTVCPSFCFLVDIKSFPISANHGDNTATCPSHRGS